MAMGGDGPWAVAVMWALTAIVFVFVLLRLYTRVIVVKSYGMDDNVYVFAFTLLLGFTIFIHISATYGFGQDMTAITPPTNISKAILYEAISQTFSVLGMAVAKWSLGFFLLRIVKTRWQQVAIWVVMCFLMSASITCIFMFWMQCTPFPYLWDRTIPGGYCDLPQLGISIVLGGGCVFTDLFFALFPWFFMWKLQMNRREKFVILGSMSLGIVAAGFGIKRATEIPELFSLNYLKDTVGIIVWSAAEMAVTMICISIPICRPLYKHHLDRLLSLSARSTDNYKRSYNYSPRPPGLAGLFPLRTVGGTPMSRLSRSKSKSRSRYNTHNTTETTATTYVNDDNEPDTWGDRRDVEAGSVSADSTERKIGLRGPFTKAYAVATERRVKRDDQSEEVMLGDDFRQSQVLAENDSGGIMVVDEFSVTTSKK